MPFDFGQNSQLLAFPSRSYTGETRVPGKSHDTVWSPAAGVGMKMAGFWNSEKRDVMVNRLLDWAEQARAHGHENRSEELTLLAWEAYERLT